MSPVPIIDLQRRLSLVGAIRCGEKTEKGAPRKLDTFRITTPTRTLADQAATLYGGEVTPWQSPAGTEWQVVTTATELPVLVMPSYSLTQTYELWEGATKRTRVCDGQEMSDGTPCQCETEGQDKCDLYTRLVVALPELDTVLGWRLITKGVNAGHELPTLMALIQSVADRRPFVPAKLRLVERKGVKDGQTVRYVVPTLDLGAGYAALAARSALPQLEAAQELAYQPVQPKQLTAVTVEEGLAAAGQNTRKASGRTTAPIADTGDDFDTAPVPHSEDETAARMCSEAQRRRLFAIAKEHGVSTEGVKAAVLEVTGQDSTKGIPMDQYEAVVAAVEGMRS